MPAFLSLIDAFQKGPEAKERNKSKEKGEENAVIEKELKKFFQEGHAGLEKAKEFYEKALNIKFNE